eukprot:10234401-Alexandrium_andersonii.AAC.1
MGCACFPAGPRPRLGSLGLCCPAHAGTRACVVARHYTVLPPPPPLPRPHNPTIAVPIPATPCFLYHRPHHHFQHHCTTTPSAIVATVSVPLLPPCNHCCCLQRVTTLPSPASASPRRHHHSWRAALGKPFSCLAVCGRRSTLSTVPTSSPQCRRLHLTPPSLPLAGRHDHRNRTLTTLIWPPPQP